LIWKIEFDDAAAKELRKLDRQIQKEILHYLRKRIATKDDPRRFGKPLSHSLVCLWRYRIRNYRIICNIEEDKLVVLIVRIAHRKDVYS